MDAAEAARPHVLALLQDALAEEPSALNDLACFVLRAASNASSLHDACSDSLDGPSRRSMNRWLEHLDLDRLERSANDGLCLLAGSRFPRRPVVGVDLTLIPYHGEVHMDESELKRGPAKDGTTWFHAYATAYVCMENRRYTFLVHFVRRTETPTQALEWVLDELERRDIRPKLVLADKAFATHDAICSLKKRRFSFIVPLPARGKKAKDLQHGKGSYWTNYQLGGESVRVAVVIKRNGKKYHGKKPGNQYFPYIAHGHHGTPKRIDQLYRKRGGIESSYKLNNQARPRTSSRRPATRLFYFATSFLLQNAWINLAWTLSPPKRGRTGRLRPRGFFTLRRFLRLVRYWTEIILGLVTTITQLPSTEASQ